MAIEPINATVDPGLLVRRPTADEQALQQRASAGDRRAIALLLADAQPLTPVETIDLMRAAAPPSGGEPGKGQIVDLYD